MRLGIKILWLSREIRKIQCYQGKLEGLFDVDKFKENKKNIYKKHLFSKDQAEI
jgi:hypothetical protein